jgi:MAP/microtubule affinity-regulating kinase
VTTGRIENYALGKHLGQGAYAAVKMGTHRATKQRYAIKTYEKAKLSDPQRKQSVKREMRILEKLSHPRIIQFHESFEGARQINIVMEYVGGTSLHSYVRRHSGRKLVEADAKRLFRQIVEGVAYCHGRAVTHRDIKLENILLDEQSNVKIIDFGFATCMPIDHKSRVFCGTPSYMAPEIVNRKDYFGPPVDVWALGVLLFAMLSGTFPFRGINDKDLYKKISRGAFIVPTGVPETAKSMICSMISIDPSRRPTCSDLLLQPWLAEDTATIGASRGLDIGDLQVKATEENEVRQADTEPHKAIFELFERLRREEGGVLGASNRRS